jgi:hypothetical protein
MDDKRQEVPTMLEVCAYCKKEVGRVKCSPEQVGEVTHGVCRECFKALTGREPTLTSNTIDKGRDG